VRLYNPRNAKACDGCSRSFDRRLRAHVELGPIVQQDIWCRIAEYDFEELCESCMMQRAQLRLDRALTLADLRPCRWNLQDQPHSWFDYFLSFESAPPSNLAAWRAVGVHTKPVPRPRRSPEERQADTDAIAKRVTATVLGRFVAAIADPERKRLVREIIADTYQIDVGA
jgi:hypothetical protein